MSFGVHPFILVAAAGALLALIAVIIACKARNGFTMALMLLLAVVFIAPAGYVFLAFHPQFVDGRFRTYKAFYRDIQIGMTREQVFTILDRHYPKSGPRQHPKVMDDTTNSLGFFMNPETSREPNCEGIFLKLEGGRVKSKDYSPD
jgi:hypothetical protein